MSPRAALRLEHFGFTDVYDYVPGKNDWTAAGLPREGHSSHVPNAGDVIHTDIPTCHFRDRLDDALKSMEAAGVGFCVAVDQDRIVVGRLLIEDAQRQQGDATVEETMRSGPTTIRANEPLEALLERMRSAGVEEILVTDPEGKLLGLLDRDAAEGALKKT